MGTNSIKRMEISRNLERVQERINTAARKAGRSTDEIKIMVVTKTHPIEVIEWVLAAGVTDLGENYVEEATEKIIALHQYSPCTWHMIGHVQSRKSSQVVEYFDYLHSLDSLKLAQRLSARARERNKTLPVLLEFNLSGEESKSGWGVRSESELEALLPDIESITALENLTVCGLMTMPPYFDISENARPYFRMLRRLRELLQKKFQHIDWKELSMGMSGDFEIAIEEGATWVRIGQAILGERHQ